MRTSYRRSRSSKSHSRCAFFNKLLDKNYPEHLPEFELALNTGLRLSELYWRTWENVNLERRILAVPRSKHGERRHVPLNSMYSFKMISDTR